MENPLEDSTIRATIYRERYNRGLYTQLIRLLEDIELSALAKINSRVRGMSAREIEDFLAGNATTRRLKELVALVATLSLDIRRTVSNQVNTGIRDLVEAELDFASQLLTSAGFDYTGKQLATITATVAAVKARPIQGRHVRDFVKDFAPNVRRQIAQALRIGFSSGSSSDEIARDLAESFDITHRGATLLVRTAMTHTSAVSYKMQYRELGIRKIRWLSQLDGRTSMYCRGMSGKVFDIDSKHPEIPGHPACRSVWVPVIPNIDGSDLVQPYVADTRPVSKIPKSERKDKIGQIKGGTSYDEWLRKQSTEFQKEVLTGTQYRLFKKGKKLDKFIDMRSQTTYTSAELKEKYSSILNNG